MKTENTKQFSGHFSLTFRDADTLEVLRTVDETNTITDNAIFELFMSDGHLRNSSFSAAGFLEIYVADVEIVKTTSTFPSIGNLLGSQRVPESQEVQNWTALIDTNGTQVLERVARFNAPTSIRTFNVIANADDGGGTGSYALLTTPCIQNPGEVLDITYRLQLIESTNPNAEKTTVQGYTRAFAEALAQNSRQGAPELVNLGWASIPSTTDIAYGIPTHANTVNDFTDNDTTRDFRNFKIVFNMDMEVDDHVGRVVRTVEYGDKFSTSSFESGYRSTSVTPFFPDDSPHKPIQPVHNHNANAIEWGLDVDFLATSQGTVTLNGDNWTQEDFPEFWRIDHTLTGPVGTSRYAIRTRKINGFDGITYGQDQNATFKTRRRSGTVGQEDRQTFDGTHGMEEYEQLVGYDGDSFITWDSTGITLWSVNTVRQTTIDTTTTPLLPVSAISQVAVDAFGNVFVTDPSGLYRITDILTNPQVDHIVTSPCHGVAVGFDDKLWVVETNALMSTANSDDASPLFTSYDANSTPAIDFATETTTGGLSHVRYLRLDRSSPDDQMALVYNETIGSQEDDILWWSTAGVASPGPVETSSRPWGRTVCSRFGAIWMTAGDSTGQFGSFIEFGSPSDIQTSIIMPGAMHAAMYDYYKVPHFVRDVNSSYTIVADRMRRTVTNDGVNGIPFTANRSSGGLFAINEGESHNFFMESRRFVNDTSSSSDVIAQPVTDFISTQRGPRDALNGQYTALEEMVWKRMHHDGTNWIEDYYVDAVDTGNAGPFPGLRHNFDTESHFFTGRSMVDMSPSLSVGAASNFSNEFTLAVTVSGEPKDRRVFSGVRPQEAERTIFSLYDGNTNIQLLWDDDEQDDIAVYIDNTKTVLGSTLANGITHRVVAAINGTSLDVYLNGSKLGNTVTLPTAFSAPVSDNGGVLFLGSRSFVTKFAQRHQPLPGEFFRGLMTNAQVWNVAWGLQDVVNDAGDFAGLITSQPAAALVSRYELTESLLGTETKATHATSDLVARGVEIAFADGAAGDSFVATDYHTVGIVDGMLKDSAISLTQHNSYYFKPVDFNYTGIENNVGGNTITADTVQVTEPARWGLHRVSGRTKTVTGNRFRDQTHTFATKPGEMAYNSSSGSANHKSTSTNFGALIAQPIISDGYIQVTPNISLSHDFVMGLATSVFDNIHGVVGGRYDHIINLAPTGTVNIWEGASGTVVASNVHTHTHGDRYRITRTGGVVTYEVVDTADVVTVLYTSLVASTGTAHGRFDLNSFNSLVDITVNYEKPGHLMTTTDTTLLTGAANPTFIGFDGTEPQFMSVQLDGVEAVVTTTDESIYGNHADPAPGEVLMFPQLGWIRCNPADAGKLVTTSVVAIYDQL